MVRWPVPPAPRRGINLVGLIVLVLAMVGIGVGMMRLAQQAGRSGHWFHDGQLAHDVADAGLKQMLYQLTRTNSLAAVPQAPQELQAALTQVFTAVTGGQAPGTIDLMTKAGGYPPAIVSLLKRIKDHAPLVDVELEVKLTMAPSTPLWDNLLEGVPAVQGERKGSISLQSKATVKSPIGIPMTRRVILEKGYKVINLVPPVLGRFSLFVQDSPPAADNPNRVPMRFDQPATGASNGNAVYDGNARPLVLESDVVEPLVAANTKDLDRGRFVGAISDLKFLDKQGWVYLGGTPAAPWKLNLAHGYGEGGESPLVPGFRPLQPTPGPAGFNNGMKTELDAQLAGANQSSTCVADLSGPTDGLYTVLHGFAENFELISLPTGGNRVVQPGGARSPLMDFNDVTPDDTSCLRLFGEPERCSPTLVFGPAYRLVMQRAMVWALIGGFGCNKAGRRPFHCFRWGKHGPREERVIAAGFQDLPNYKLFGTYVREDRPFAEALQVVLSAQGNGTYGSTGLLTQSGTGGTDKTWSSDLFPLINNFAPATGLPPPALDALVQGKLDSPLIYKGALSAGFKAFSEVMQKKLTYELKPDAFTRLVVTQGKIKVPGAILVDQPGPLTIPAITKIEEGGILMSQGPITISGDIVHGPPPAAPALPEPLTIVSLKGDITIAPSVRNIEAMLIALDGQVKFGGAGDITITGGVATKVLDPKTIVLGGKRKIKYSKDIDPNGPNRTVFKVFYGGEDRVACVGEEEKP